MMVNSIDAPNRVRVLGTVLFEERLEFGHEVGDRVMEIGADTNEYGHSGIFEDLAWVTSSGCDGNSRLRQGVDVGGTGSVGTGVQGVAGSAGVSCGLDDEWGLHAGDINSI
jgi:hypothetical protein